MLRRVKVGKGCSEGFLEGYFGSEKVTKRRKRRFVYRLNQDIDRHVLR